MNDVVPALGEVAESGLCLLSEVTWRGTPLPGERAIQLLAGLVLHAPRAASSSRLVNDVRVRVR
ncbi:MAG: hypothetical protein L0H93_16240, partial [Nocardioides sp.]|nr:hypothetical protein [Nocardioides sp.]